MTIRALIVGVLFATFIAAAGYVNDCILRMPPLINGHVPVIVLGLLLLSLLTVQPLLHAVPGLRRFRPGESATVVAMAMAVCSIPSYGLMRLFSPVLVLPMQYAQQLPGWRDHEVLDYAPPPMLANDGRYDPRVVSGFLSGLSDDGAIGLADVPWGGWARTLAFWGPLIALIGVAVVCLAVIAHHQWSRREHLAYPLARLADTLIGGEDDCAFGPIFRSRAFWLGLAIVWVVQMINTWHAVDERMIEIPLSFRFSPIVQKWPDLKRAPYYGGLIYVSVMPIAIGFAYLLSSEVSFSIGIAQLVQVLVFAAMVTVGIDISSDRLTGGAIAWHHFGGYLAAGGFLVYTGRRYYAAVARRAFLFRRDRDAPPAGVWAARGLLVSVAGAVGMLCGVGLAWPLAILLIGLILLLYFVLARINAETGLFMLSGTWTPLAVLLGLFGAAAMGPVAIVVAGLVSVLLTMDTHESLMPFVTNGLKIGESNRVRPGPLAGGMAGMFVAGLVVAGVVSIWANYNWGMPRWSSHAYRTMPQATFRIVDTEITRMQVAGQLEASRSKTALQRLAAIRPEGRLLRWAGFGFVLVAGCYLCRLRFARWPLHPVMFLVWCTWGLQFLWASFLIGWAVKTAVFALGGGRSYRRGMPLMIGLIAGDLLGRVSIMLIGTGHYALTGTTLPDLLPAAW